MTVRVLEELSKNCDPCQRIARRPGRFGVAFGTENVTFNDRIMMDDPCSCLAARETPGPAFCNVHS